LSLAFSSRITLPDREPEPDDDEGSNGWQRFRHQWTVIRGNALFSRFLLSQFVFRMGMSMVLPLFPLYWVRQLHASDAAIGLINTVQGGILLVAYFIWSRLARRWGLRAVLLQTSFGLFLHPFFTALTPSVELLILYAAFAGFVAAGIDLVLFDLALATCPPNHQTTYVGIYQMTNNMAIFFAPLLGTLLADRLGIVPALLVGASLRLAGFLLYYWLRVGEKREEA
jgi:predicted MFS family arabinose efflux permease